MNQLLRSLSYPFGYTPHPKKFRQIPQATENGYKVHKDLNSHGSFFFHKGKGLKCGEAAM